MFPWRLKQHETCHEETCYLHICENKGTDQLRGIPAADQHLCFRFVDSTIPLLPKFEISSLYPSSVAVQPGLCQTWSESARTCFLVTRLILTMHLKLRSLDGF